MKLSPPHLLAALASLLTLTIAHPANPSGPHRLLAARNPQPAADPAGLDFFEEHPFAKRTPYPYADPDLFEFPYQHFAKRAPGPSPRPFLPHLHRRFSTPDTTLYPPRSLDARTGPPFRPLRKRVTPSPWSHLTVPPGAPTIPPCPPAPPTAKNLAQAKTQYAVLEAWVTEVQTKVIPQCKTQPQKFYVAGAVFLFQNEIMESVANQWKLPKPWHDYDYGWK
ncbi:hypothetical protein MMC19_007242 [Ptychographa xylographoides]|nr:hypothetical protein [Ptychographa xylographoides]